MEVPIITHVEVENSLKKIIKAKRAVTPEEIKPDIYKHYKR